jgi:hypothetical protein
MIGIFSFGNAIGLLALFVLGVGIYRVLAARNRPEMSVASMLRTPDKDR